MAQTFRPADFGQICLEQQYPLASCSQTGFMFLALVTQLFGSSRDSVEQEEFSQFGDISRPQSSYGLGPTLPTLETSIYGPTSAVPHFSDIIKSLSSLGPVLEKPFKYGASTSFYMKKENEPVVKFGFNSEFGNERYPNFDRTFDIAASDSKVTEQKVPVKHKEKVKKNRRKRQVEEYDFIIVGAGSAGCVLANRLSEVKHWKVLLLEAGPEEPDVTSVPGFAPVLASSSIDWNYSTQPEELTCRSRRGQTCPWFRGKTMGGSSAINYMVYMRGNKRDYDKWAEMGNHGWSYKDVLPYFKKAENNHDIEAKDKVYHHVGGPLNVERYPYLDINTLLIVEGFKELGLPVTDFNGANQLGTDIAQSTSFNGRRWSTNIGYIKPIRHKRPNLKILTGALVTKVIIDPVTKTAHGVEFVKEGLLRSVFAKKEVIVSSGPLNSPKILMLSGIGPKYHLESLGIHVLSDLKVGHNLQDHVTTDAFIISLSNRTAQTISSKALLQSVSDFRYQGQVKHGPLSSTGPTSGIAFIKTEFAIENAPDIQYHFDTRRVNDYYGDPTIYAATNYFPGSEYYDGLSVRPLLLVPKSRGVVMLNRTDPLFGPPLIYSRFFTDKSDLDVLLAGFRFAIGLEKTEAFKHSGAHFIKIPIHPCSHFLWGTDEYFTCILVEYTSTIYHPAGTCKMGPVWDKDAVVDPRLKVYGIKKLRVIDSSIMPNIIRGNLNAPTIMIAEKASDMIKEEWIL